MLLYSSQCAAANFFLSFIQASLHFTRWSKRREFTLNGRRYRLYIILFFARLNEFRRIKVPGEVGGKGAVLCLLEMTVCCTAPVGGAQQTVILLRQKMEAMEMHCVSLHKLAGPGKSMLFISWNKACVAKFVYPSQSAHIHMWLYSLD